MFRISPKEKRKAALYKLLHNGYRYALWDGEKVVKSFRYEYQATPHKRHGLTLKLITDLIDENERK